MIDQKLGFDRVLDKLGQYFLSSLGKTKLEQITFLSDHRVLEFELTLVKEFVRILQEKDFPADNFFDLRPQLQRLKKNPVYFLDEADLQALMRSQITIKNILNFFKTDEHKQLFPAFAKKIRGIRIYPFVTDLISGVLNKEGRIKDSASAELKVIREEIKDKEHQVSAVVRKVLKIAAKEGYLDDDAQVVVRNGKLLIPVLAMFKNKIAGIVQDYSASGKTVYIEPIRSVELNNRISELKFEEKREILKILAKVSDDLRPYADDLLSGYDFLADVDFIRAKALLAIDLKAIMPEIIKMPAVSLKQAKHPLLVWKYRNEGKKVVPLDLQLGENQRIILISGPNAGGKSIAVKTVGLLQYMMQCGFLVPVAEGTKMGIFNRIFVDIGDEQSIENDLSTYSSRLLTMKEILRNANEKSLVLIDEFGSGTDPAMGGAIAEAILEELLDKRIKAVINTHYSNLKHFATFHQGIENAAMLFDKDNLKPLYVLVTGQPGSSFAFEIARNIGLPNDLIKKAEQKAGSKVVDFDRIIAEMEHNARQLRKERQEIGKLKKELSRRVTEYREAKEKMTAKRKEIIENAEKEADEILKNLNRLIEQTIKEIRKQQAEKEATKRIRKDLAHKKQEIVRKIKRSKQQAEAEYKEVRKKLKKQTQKEKQKTEIQAGDVVKIVSKGMTGEVETIKDGMAMVLVGQLRTFVKLEDLEKVGRKKQERKVKVNISLNEEDKPANFVMGIDVRGKRTAEALQRIVKYIDTAIMSDVKEIKILHGTGDGILRQQIRSYLKTLDYVEWFGDEDIRLGGAGITVVRFK